VKGAYSIDVSENYIVCACTNGIVRLFEPVTLKYLGTLPKPHPLGVDLTLQTGTTYNGTGDPNDSYPDTLALKLDTETGKLTCIYSDRSLFIWDIKDVKKMGKYRSFLYHCDTIWGVEMVPDRDPNSTSESILPENTFVTYSADSTIRFWNLDGTNSATNQNSTSTHGIKRNIYSKECLKIVYVDPDGSYRSSAVINKNDQPDSTDQSTSAPVELGIRTLKISPDGKLMASGDRGGNLRVHDLDTFEELTYQEAHDAEILTIEFTDGRIPDAPYLIATASRDRILHVFDINTNYQLIQTLDDHSSSITAIKFTNDGGRLISCGADKTTVFDMDIDVSNRYIGTVSGERRLNVFQIETGKNVRSYKSDTPDEVNAADQGSLLRISLDPGGVYAVTGGSDKSVRLFDFATGTILGKVLGHSELITCVKFTPDCERVISTSADGCIFVWKISDELVSKMRQKWLNRSGVGRTSPVMKDYLSSPQLSSSPISPIIRATTMPAQRPQSIMLDLQQQSESVNGRAQDFTVRSKNNKSSSNLKVKKSYSSLITLDTQIDDNTKKLGGTLRRPVSFANDGSSQPKPIQLSTTSTPRPISEFSPTRIPTTKSPPPNSPLSDTSLLVTPPNTPISPNMVRRESWKIGLPNWAKKAFKEKDAENSSTNVVNNDNVNNNINNNVKNDVFNVSDNSFNVEKKLFNATRPLNKTKSQSKLRQDLTIQFLSEENNDQGFTSMTDNVIFDDSLPISDNAETIFVESQGEEEYEEYIVDNENTPTPKLRRKSSFVGKNVQKLEMFLATHLKPDAIDKSNLTDNDHLTKDLCTKKRQSLTTKFYSVNPRQLQDSSDCDDGLLDSIKKLILKSEPGESIPKENSSTEDIEKTLEVLEGKKVEVVNQVNKDGSLIRQMEAITSAKDPSSNDQKDLEENKETIDDDEIKVIENKGDGLGIIITEITEEREEDNEKKTIIKSDDAPITRNNTIASDDQLNEDNVMDDLLNMTILLERTLNAYKKASNNESMAKLISDSLLNMMDDISKSINIERQSNNENHDNSNNCLKEEEINRKSVNNDKQFMNDNDNKDSNYHEEEENDSNNSYYTAITSHSNENELSPNINNINKSNLMSMSPPSKPNLQLSEEVMYDFLEKYSELLIKTVDEKITAKFTPTLVTKSSIDELGSNCINTNLSSKSTKSIKGSIPVGISKNKFSKSRFV
ncbi:10987_t:CDS:2, partial [Diversispora eburnea]